MAMTAVRGDAARKFRSSPAWKSLRARVVARARSVNAPCPTCSAAIIWDAPRWHPLGPSVDHLQPLKTLDLSTAEGRRAALDPANLRVLHVRCNSLKENWSRRRVNGSAAVPATGSAMVPVCNGRSCACAGLGSEPSDDCPFGGPPRWVPFTLGSNGWVQNAA
jgi:hypothetical protein